MKGLAEIKASILCAASHGQLNHVVDEACKVARFTIDLDMSYSENADMALAMDKRPVFEILTLAQARARQL